MPCLRSSRNCVRPCFHCFTPPTEVDGVATFKRLRSTEGVGQSPKYPSQPRREVVISLIICGRPILRRVCSRIRCLNRTMALGAIRLRGSRSPVKLNPTNFLCPNRTESWDDKQTWAKHYRDLVHVGRIEFLDSKGSGNGHLGPVESPPTRQP